MRPTHLEPGPHVIFKPASILSLIFKAIYKLSMTSLQKIVNSYPSVGRIHLFCVTSSSYSTILKPYWHTVSRWDIAPPGLRYWGKSHSHATPKKRTQPFLDRIRRLYHKWQHGPMSARLRPPANSAVLGTPREPLKAAAPRQERAAAGDTILHEPLNLMINEG